MSMTTRREFSKEALGTLLSFSLVDALFQCDAFAAEAKPITVKWLKDMNDLGIALKGETISQPQWQQRVESLLGEADVVSLLKIIDFEKLTKNLKFVDNGVRSLRFDFQQIEGMPKTLAYGKQIFAFKKDRSVVPHGHNNMATAFLILRGGFRGRHYDRVEDQSDHIIIRPTIDRKFGPGEYSTVTDFKDNIHWFKSESEPAFIFNIHALNVNPGSEKRTGRVYLDPQGEAIEGGLIRSRRIDHTEAHKLYG